MLGRPNYPQEGLRSTTQPEVTSVLWHSHSYTYVGEAQRAHADALGNVLGGLRSNLVQALIDGSEAEKNSSHLWSIHGVLGTKLLRFTCAFWFHLTFPYKVVTIIIPNFQIQKLRLRKGHTDRNGQDQDSSSKSNSSPPCHVLCP